MLRWTPRGFALYCTHASPRADSLHRSPLVAAADSRMTLLPRKPRTIKRAGRPGRPGRPVCRQSATAATVAANASAPASPRAATAPTAAPPRPLRPIRPHPGPSGAAGPRGGRGLKEAGGKMQRGRGIYRAASSRRYFKQAASAALPAGGAEARAAASGPTAQRAKFKLPSKPCGHARATPPDRRGAQCGQHQVLVWELGARRSAGPTPADASKKQSPISYEVKWQLDSVC